MYQFCNVDLNKFALLLKKGVYPYEYMITGKDLMKHHYHLKMALYSELNLEEYENARPKRV